MTLNQLRDEAANTNINLKILTKMKKNSFTIIVLFAIGFLFSCEKESNDVQNNELTNTQASNYFIDDVPVSLEEYDDQSSDLLQVFVIKPTNNLKSSSPDNTEIENRAYSSQENYIAYGKEIGVDFEKQLVFETIMREYSQITNVEEIYEKTGEVPTWYTAREQFVYDSLYGVSGLKSMQASLTVFLFENINSSGSKIPMPIPGTFTVMPPNWDNRVSSIEFLGAAGTLTVYNKTFYRDKLGTVVGFGIYPINLTSLMDNKMSSCVSFL